MKPIAPIPTVVVMSPVIPMTNPRKTIAKKIKSPGHLCNSSESLFINLIGRSLAYAKADKEITPRHQKEKPIHFQNSADRAGARDYTERS